MFHHCEAKKSLHSKPHPNKHNNMKNPVLLLLTAAGFSLALAGDPPAHHQSADSATPADHKGMGCCAHAASPTPAAHKGMSCCAHEAVAAPSAESTAAPEGLAADSRAKAKPYPLATCLVSGEKLGEMGDPVVFTHEGQEIKLCCKSCKPKFDKAPATYLKKLETKK